MQFNEETFDWLGEQEQFLHGWTNIDFAEFQTKIDQLIADGITEDLAPEIYKSIETLGLFIDGVGLEAPESVLSLVADENGIIEKILGPAIFAEVNDDEKTGKLVLRVGNEMIPVGLDGAEATIGTLKGDIELEEKDGKDEAGVDIKFLTASLEVYFSQNDESAVIPVVLEKDHGLSKAKFKQVLKSGLIAEYVKVPSTGANYKKLRDLEIGEYNVLSVEENPVHPEYGRSWKIELEGVGYAISSGKRLVSNLEKRAKLYDSKVKQGHPLVFVISSKKEMSQGVQVVSGFFFREPNPQKLAVQLKPAKASTKATPQIAPSMTIPVAAKSVATTAKPAKVAAAVSADEIDF